MSATEFTCEKRPATGSRGMVVTNHPLGSAAGAEMLLSGGNAIDAAVASLFALTVVEPMMVGILGGGVAHVRTADGQHHIIDGLSTAPREASAQMYDTLPGEQGNYRATRNRANEVGGLAIAVPGALAGWTEALARFGTMSLADVLQPAIRLASRGFLITHYLSDCVRDTARDIASDPGLSSLFMPGGEPLRAGDRLVQGDYAATLTMLAAQGPQALRDGLLGRAFLAHVRAKGGVIGPDDLAHYRPLLREPVCGAYRGFEILGPPPPASAGVHVVQMLNILEGFDIGAAGFGTAGGIHLLAEAMKIAFADRQVATADPDFVDVPVAQLVAKAYAAERRAEIDVWRARAWSPGVATRESHNTTHVTVADAAGNVVATTQTINGLFGACVQIPETGMLANNYMYNFDPRPGGALSVAPGKRVFTSMAPMMVRQGGKLKYALGLPGALRIFPSAMQAIVNLLDHGMPLQRAVEAPRIWTDGGPLELEPAIPEAVADELARRGHSVRRVGRIAGGMNAVAFEDDGTLTGAACWRADGTPVAIAGGLARAGVRFSV